MNSLPLAALKALQQPLLGCASLLVPAGRRGDWRREWHAELWHVREACVPAGGASWQAECTVALFCLGAFPDALFLRRQPGQPSAKSLPSFAPLAGSPARCLTCLGSLLAICYLVSVILPGVRAEQRLAWNHAYSGVLLIRNAHSTSDTVPTISPNQFQRWARGKGKYFDEFAFYRVAHRAVVTGSSTAKVWNIAHASANLFTLLGVPIRFAPADKTTDGRASAVILSDSLWRRAFAADPHIAGTVLHMNGQEFRVAGVAPRGSWRLPEKVDAWLLEPGDTLRSAAPGYLVAHLSSRGQSEMWARRQLIKAYGPQHSEEDLLGLSLDDRVPPPWAVFVFALLLALLALPATVSVSLSEYSLLSHKLSWSRRLRRWAFLAGKILLLLPIAYFASLDCAYAGSTLFSPLSVYLRLFTCFLIFLAGMGWAVRDQHQRCPVCLRRVTHPARVGSASQTFLGWSGTELICAGGHTLLHIPALPTSWFSSQRWLYLDGSWDFLFAG